MFSYNFFFSLRRALAARGPLLSGQQKVGKDWRKGVSPPCGSPDQSGVLDAPLWKPPSPRWRALFGRTPRRLRGWSFGARLLGRERLRARPGCRGLWGLTPPGPPRFPNGKVCRSCAPIGGFAPWPPKAPKRKSLLIMREGAWDNVRCGFCGNAFANPARKLQPQRGEEFRRSLARLCRRHSSATAVGGFQRGNAFGLLFCLLFCRSRKVGARRGLSASKG